MPTCPPVSLVNKCIASTSDSTCGEHCTWCQNATSYQCRPTSTFPNLCEIQGDPIEQIYPNCIHLLSNKGKKHRGLRRT